MAVKIEIPNGLTELLQNFTITVLREYPAGSGDLLQFAADYFNQKLKDSRPMAAKSQVRFGFHESIEYSGDEESDFEGPPTEQMIRRPSVAAESYDPENEDSDDENVIPVNEKTEEQKARLEHATQDILIFRCLDKRQRELVIKAMKEVLVDAGTTIIRQGDEGDNFYVIEKGHFDVTVQLSNGTVQTSQDKYVDQGSFGELALMYNTPRAATITATTAGILWSMDRQTFRRIVLKRAFHKRQMYEKLLKRVPILGELSDYERAKLADALESKEFEDGDMIIQQGNVGKEMYFIESGEVRFVRRSNSLTPVNSNLTGVEKQVNIYSEGGYFGEIALITHKPTAASAYAVGHTKVAALDIAVFERLMGPCVPIMKRNFSTYQAQLKDILGEDVNISELRGESDSN